MATLSATREFNVTTHFVDRHLEEGNGHRTALITAAGTTSYDALAARTNRIGNVLRELGLRPEQRVLIALADGVDFVATWYAVLKVGAVTAEAYTFLTAEDYAYYLDYTRAEIVVVDASVLDTFREAATSSRYLRTLLVVGADADELRDGEAHFETLVDEAPDELEVAPTSPDDIAIWKFTTGSTGHPKACVHRMDTPRISYERYARGVLDLQPDDVVLPVPKLFFGYARDMAALFPFGAGAAGIVFPERSRPDVLFDLIEQHRPTILAQVPTMMRAMLEHEREATADLSCLRLCTSAGEALPESLYHQWKDRFGVEVLDGIGSSEAYHIYLSNRLGRVKPGTAGEAMPGYEPRVVDGDGNDLPDGEIGRLWINAETAALGYFNDHAKSRAMFAGDLVMSDDLFVRDADGYFAFRGRADELIKVSGVWVAPVEIERVLDAHEAVAECAVVPIDRDGLTSTRGYVVLHDGATATAEELQGHCRSQLSPHKFPREVRFVDSLPKTGNGKVDRRALRDAD